MVILYKLYIANLILNNILSLFLFLEDELYSFSFYYYGINNRIQYKY